VIDLQQALFHQRLGDFGELAIIAKALGFQHV
jgi:hypothetical protein